MIGNIRISAYQQIARMQTNLNNFISQASIAKSQIMNEILASSYRSVGIGRNVDITV